MQRQQEYTRLCNHPNLHYYPSVGHDSFINAGLSEYSQDDSISMQQVAMAHSLLQLADAQVRPDLLRESPRISHKFGLKARLEANLI